MWSPRARLSTTFKFRHRVGTASISAASSTEFPRPSCHLDEPREPVRSCQTPRPPPLDLPSLRESASLGGRIRPFPAFTHPRNQVVCIHSSVLLFSLHPLSKVASHKQGQNQNPKIQKQKKAKRAMGREIPQGLDKVTAASQSQNQ